MTKTPGQLVQSVQSAHSVQSQSPVPSEDSGSRHVRFKYLVTGGDHMHSCRVRVFAHCEGDSPSAKWSPRGHMQITVHEWQALREVLEVAADRVTIVVERLIAWQETPWAKARREAGEAAAKVAKKLGVEAR